MEWKAITRHQAELSFILSILSIFALLVGGLWGAYQFYEFTLFRNNLAYQNSLEVNSQRLNDGSYAIIAAHKIKNNRQVSSLVVTNVHYRVWVFDAPSGNAQVDFDVLRRTTPTIETKSIPELERSYLPGSDFGVVSYAHLDNAAGKQIYYTQEITTDRGIVVPRGEGIAILK